MALVMDNLQIAKKLLIFFVNFSYLFYQAKRRLALDDSDHHYQSEPAKTPRGRGAGAPAIGSRLKAPRSKADKYKEDPRGVDCTASTEF